MQKAAQVGVYTLGGTIAMTSMDGGPVTPALSADDLLTAVPAIGQLGLELKTCNFRQVPGGSLTFSDVAALHEAIQGDLAAGATGAVITQGTDTIEETAYLLHLLHQLPQPVVVTGAMRHPSLPSPDGPANLLAAVQVAVDPASQARGCLVVTADQIHSARYVTKAHTTATTAFSSENGSLGRVVEGRPSYWQPAADRISIDLPPASAAMPLVGLVTATLGDTGEWIENYSTGLDGLVSCAGSSWD